MQRLVLFLLWFLNSIALAEPGAAEYRTFTSQSGRELRARLLRLEDGVAHCRRSTGEAIAIPITSLSLEDQAYLQNWDPEERKKEWFAGLSLNDFLARGGFAAAPFTPEEQAITIPVAVNGQPMDFDFDPGRFLSLLDRERAREVGGVPTEVIFADFTLADGSKESVLATVFDTFDIGAAHLTKWEMGVVSFPKIQMKGNGVLGSDALELMDALVDWEKRRIHFRPGSTAAPGVPLGLPAPELREYTSENGTTVLGEFAGLGEDGLVTLRVDGGKRFQAPLTAFSLADREYLDLWTSHPAFDTEENAARAVDFLRAKGYASVPYTYGSSTVAGFEMQLGGETLRFLLNATLPITYLDRATAARVGLAASPVQEHLVIGGQKYPLHLAEIANLSVEGGILPPFPVRITDLAAAGAAEAIPIRTCMIFRAPEIAKRRAGRIEVDGILGRDWLLQMKPWIDYSSQKMLIRPRKKL